MTWVFLDQHPIENVNRISSPHNQMIDIDWSLEEPTSMEEQFWFTEYPGTRQLDELFKAFLGERVGPEPQRKSHIIEQDDQLFTLTAEQDTVLKEFHHQYLQMFVSMILLHIDLEQLSQKFLEAQRLGVSRTQFLAEVQ